MLTLSTGDLFTTPGLDALAHGVNCAGKMGKGIAVEFRRRWPRMYTRYQQLCQNHELFPGNIFSFRAKEDLWIYNLATQDQPGPRASLDAIWLATCAMAASMSLKGIQRVGLPRIGCGLGGLRWEDVHPLLKKVAERYPAVELVVVSRPEDLR